MLNDEERKKLERTEHDLGRPLTEEEEDLVLQPGVDLHSNLRLGPIWVKGGTEIETDASFSLNLSAKIS